MPIILVMWETNIRHLWSISSNRLRKGFNERVVIWTFHVRGQSFVFLRIEQHVQRCIQCIHIHGIPSVRALKKVGALDPLALNSRNIYILTVEIGRERERERERERRRTDGQTDTPGV